MRESVLEGRWLSRSCAMEGTYKVVVLFYSLRMHKCITIGNQVKALDRGCDGEPVFGREGCCCSGALGDTDR